MPKRTWVKVSGVWKALNNIWVKQVGDWLPYVMSYAKYNSVWRECMTYGGIIKDLDNNEYNTVLIGTQEWIIQNLKVTQYADTSSISNLTVDADWVADTTGAYCWYDNDIANKAVYGALYNWHAVNNVAGLPYFTRGGIEETGWRVATDLDYTTLYSYLGGESIVGGKMKEVGYDHWLSPNTGATNISGFTALPNGYRNVYGSYLFLESYCTLWSSTEYLTTSAYFRDMYYDSPYLTRGYLEKTYGFSVRCVRDII